MISSIIIGSVQDLGLCSTDYVEVCPQSELGGLSLSQSNQARNAQRENMAGIYSHSDRYSYYYHYHYNYYY